MNLRAASAICYDRFKKRVSKKMAAGVCLFKSRFYSKIFLSFTNFKLKDKIIRIKLFINRNY